MPAEYLLTKYFIRERTFKVMAQFENKSNALARAAKYWAQKEKDTNEVVAVCTHAELIRLMTCGNLEHWSTGD